MDDHARALADRVGVHLEAVGAVLELVGRLDRLPGQLAGLPRRHEAAAEPVGERAAEDEAARLGAEDDVGLAAAARARSSRSIVSWKYVGSATSGIRSLKTIPGFGKSGTSRTRSRRSSVAPRGSPSARRAGAARARRGAARAPARPPRATGGRRGRSCGARGCASGAPARRAARAGRPRARPSCGTSAGAARRCRTGRAGRTPRRSRRRPRGRSCSPPSIRGVSRPYSSSARASSASIPARWQSSARSSSASCSPEPGRPAALALGRPGAGGELLPDHAQRQELVALQPQDRLEALDVLLAEEPVAAARALRRQQALILEVADLRDRDVRELRLEPRADGADRVQALLGAALGGGGRAHRRRKVRRYLPICSSSSSSSSVDSIRLRLTKVPLRLPRSVIVNVSPSRTSSAWRRETVTSSRKTSHSGERPISVRSAEGKKLSPALPPPERTTSAGPLPRRSCSAAARLVGVLLRRVGHRLLARLALVEHRAAAGAEVRGLRILEPALRAIDVAHTPSFGGGRAARREDVGEPLDVDVGDALPLQPRGALGPQDVDSALEQPAAVGDLVLLVLELVDQRLEVVVGQGAEIGQRFRRAFAFLYAFRWRFAVSKAARAPRGQPQLEASTEVRGAAESPCMISSTSSRTSRSSSSDDLGRLAFGVEVDERLVGVGQHLRPAALVEELDSVGQVEVASGEALVQHPHHEALLRPRAGEPAVDQRRLPAAPRRAPRAAVRTGASSSSSFARLATAS